MVALPRLVPQRHSYSTQQLAHAQTASPALRLYLEWLDCRRPQSFNEHLRQRRHSAWVEATLATLFTTSRTEDICRFWTQAAEQLLVEAWEAAGFAQLPAALFALGKLGAQELNLSSDVDLIVVAEPAALPDCERRLREFRRLLADATDWGFALRLDFDLRPGGRLGPMITSPQQFQSYYWSEGETWERLALVRLRPIIGSESVVQQILDLAQRFSFRKFLDFTLLDDLKELRSRIHQTSSTTHPEGVNLKLSVGGIRDIELFVHALQILNGGKKGSLRTHSTQQAFVQLELLKLLPDGIATKLQHHYWQLRHLENQLQAAHDRQTQELIWTQLPKNWTWPSQVELTNLCAEVDTTVSQLLGHVQPQKPSLPDSAEAQTEWLKKQGYQQTTIDEFWPALMQATALSQKRERDEQIRRQVLFEFVERMGQLGEDRDRGFKLLVDFMKAIRAKATFFSLLLREVRLINDLSKLFCQSPYLGAILAARPELVDSFILATDEHFTGDLSQKLEQMSERRLLTEIITASHFMRDLDLEILSESLSETADSICCELLSTLKQEFANSKVNIICLGKWGSRELGVRSDLDFIFVTPSGHVPNEDDHRVARRFVSRLTDPQRGGQLYAVDLRLRPSGRAGPLLMSEDQLCQYLSTEAAAWERQSYLRYRPLEARHHLNLAMLWQRGLSDTELSELQKIRQQLLQSERDHKVDLKFSPGGLVDLEFAVQIALMRCPVPTMSRTMRDCLQHLSAVDDKWAAFAHELLMDYRFLRIVEQLIYLSSDQAHSQLDLQHHLADRLANYFQMDKAALGNKIRSSLTRVSERLKHLDPCQLNR